MEGGTESSESLRQKIPKNGILKLVLHFLFFLFFAKHIMNNSKMSFCNLNPKTAKNIFQKPLIFSFCLVKTGKSNDILKFLACISSLES